MNEETLAGWLVSEWNWYLGKVVHGATRLSRSNDGFLDLLQTAWVGAMKSLEKYRPEKGSPGVFVRWMALWEIWDAVEDLPLIRVPWDRVDTKRGVDLKERMRAVRYVRLDSNLRLEDERIRYHELIGCQPEQDSADWTQIRHLKRAVRLLPPREKDIVVSHFGLCLEHEGACDCHREPQVFREIASRYGISKWRTNSLEIRALGMLRDMLTSGSFVEMESDLAA